MPYYIMWCGVVWCGVVWYQWRILWWWQWLCQVQPSLESPQVEALQSSRSVSQAHLPNLQHSQQLVRPATGRVSSWTVITCWSNIITNNIKLIIRLKWTANIIIATRPRPWSLSLSSSHPDRVCHPGCKVCGTFLMTPECYHWLVQWTTFLNES